jgi:methionyl-tRNA formyltransferase
MRIIFAGTPRFALPSLDALAGAGLQPVAVYTRPDRPAGRGRALRASAVKSRARALGIDVVQPESLCDGAVQAALRALAPDLLVVVAYGVLLPQAVLDIPRLGCINVHASLLPRWRGAAPVQHALLAGDEETGVSIMQMDAGLDTGGVLLQQRLRIGESMTAGELETALAVLGARALVEVVRAHGAGTAVAAPQDDAAASWAARIEKRHAVIDWNAPAVRIARQVRAYNPWPVAETRLGAERLRIWRAEPLAAAAQAPPGTVLANAAGDFVIATGEGRLRVFCLQLPGRRPVEARAFLNAHRPDGVVLGET